MTERTSKLEDVRKMAYDKYLEMQNPAESEYAAYTQGLQEMQNDLKLDGEYAVYKKQAELIKHDDRMIDNISKGDRSKRNFLKAYRKINLVQDKVRQ